ncbi:TonB-dependent receptor [Mucilaginibacter achroorhodeus]|nr:TonB-dependent receptor [Mucilaginibacter achroorhodeus]
MLYITAEQKTNTTPLKNLLLVSILLIVSMMIPARLLGQENTKADLAITVTTLDGAPLSYATITITGGKSGHTDEQGKFIANNIKPGKYTITASMVGYQTASKNVDVAVGQSLDVVFTLQPGNSLSEVVVTAGRKAESIKEVPSSVSILNERQVKEQMNINPSVAAILGNTIPGLGVATNKANNAGQTLRGRQVLVLIDGIPQSTPLMNGSRDIRTIDPAVIERVEVIKGATSIYGNGSAGGIINFITKKPVAGKSFTGLTSVGISGNVVHPANTLGYRFSQMFSGNINRFSYVVSGTVNYTGVQKDAKGNVNAQPDGLGQSRTYNAFVKSNYKINDNSDVTASYNLYTSTQKSDYVNVIGKYGVKPSVGQKGDDPGESAGTPYNHNVLLTYQNRALPLNSSVDLSAYYNGFQSMNRYVAQGSAWYGPGQTKIQSYKKGVRLTLNTPWKLGNWGDGNVTYGLDLLNDRTNQILTDGRVYIPDMNMVNLAPYAQMKLDILTNLVFKAGIRYENATVTVKDYSTIAKGPNNQGSIPVTGGKIPYNATTFNAGLRYNKYDLFNPFVSFSQGFAITELGRILRSATSNTIETINTKPVITNNYEAGFSSRLGIVNLTAAYYISTSNLGANLVDNGNGVLVAQREPENVHGYELTADVNLSQQWSVGGSYAYVEGKSKQPNGAQVYLNGLRIAPPKATGYLGFRSDNKFDVKLYWIYTGNRDRFAVRSNGLYANSEGPVKSINLFNLGANYKFNTKFSAGLGIENLFNKAYYPVVAQYRAMDADYAMGVGTTANLNLYYSF